jgi:AcrR family transcriptional regulator
VSPAVPGIGGSPGLRERKKQRTRREISDVATHLFAEHGFERVTLAQIAAAADVSVKTIFNHFGSKEDLFFDRMEEFRDGLTATIEQRAEGTTVLQALRELMSVNLVPFPGTGWAGLDDPDGYERFRSFQATAAQSMALMARRATLMEEIGEHLAGVVAPQVGRNPGDPAVRTLVAMLVGAMNVRDRVLRAAVIDRLEPRDVRHRVLDVVDDAFDRLQSAYADLDRPRASSAPTEAGREPAALPSG